MNVPHLLETINKKIKKLLMVPFAGIEQQPLHFGTNILVHVTKDTDCSTIACCNCKGLS